MDETGRKIEKQDNRLFTVLVMILACVLYLAVSIVLVHVIMNSGTWPAGDDVMYHIHRGEKVYDALKSGHLWVPLDTDWYNGVEMLRYWSPLPAYVMAACIAIAGGNALNGYLVFTGVVYFISAVEWFFAGLRRKRPWMGIFLGLLWFFMPHNLMYYFQSGNLAGMLGILCVLPLMIIFLGEFLDAPGAAAALKLGLTTGLMAFCHSGFALLAMVVCLIWIIIRRLMDRDEKSGLSAIATVILGFMLAGIWFIASRNGVSSVDYTEQLKNAFQPLYVTLNPFDRHFSGGAHYYFGLAAFLAAAAGTFLSRKKSCRAGFLTAAIVCLLTSQTAYRVISVIPGGSFLWTSRMINTALALIFFCILEWGTLKKLLQILLAILLAADCLFSLPLIYGNANGVSPAERLNDQQRATLIEEAKEISEQRIALIDASSLASTGAYLTTDWKSDSKAVFGAGYEAAVTRRNITMLNRAANDGCYYYLFDRALELGSDTMVIQKSQLNEGGNDIEAVNDAADAVGYGLADSNDYYLLYHIETPRNFGVTTKYKGIAVGTAADEITEMFPALKEGGSTDLSSYSYRELSGYDLIYLNGFTMSDRSRTEKMMKKLSEHGTRIYVAADGIPEDRQTRSQTFLGVTCHPVSFSNGYPEMDTDIGTLNTTLFPRGSRHWNTVYLNGLDKVLGSVNEGDLRLAFYGTKYNKNIVFMGFNLSYYYSLTGDRSAERLLSEGMNISDKAVPDRRIVPLKVREHHSSITVKSPENHVDTTLAYHNIFESDDRIWQEHHLTYVDKGTTVIRYHVPYLWSGMAVTLLGAAGLCVQHYIYRRKKELDDFGRKEG